MERYSFAQTIPNNCIKRDEAKTYKWIKNRYMKKEAELITAAQDQALPARQKQIYIEKQKDTTACRMCNRKEKTVSVIVKNWHELSITK